MGTRVKPTILLLVIIAACSSNCFGQVRLLRTEKSNLKSDRNETGPKVSFEHISAEGIQFLQDHPEALSQIGTDQTIIGSANGSILAVKDYTYLDTVIEVRTYGVENNRLVLDHEKKFPFVHFFTQLTSGAVTVMKLDEEGGEQVDIYSKDWELLNSYIPFSEGHQGIHVQVCNDFVLLGSMERNSWKSKLALIDRNGEVIFDSPIPMSGLLSKITGSGNFFSAYCYNQSSRLQEILTFNAKGKLIWSHSPHMGAVINWAFIDGEVPFLAISGWENLSLYSAETGILIKRIDIKSLFRQANPTRPHEVILNLQIVEHDHQAFLLMAQGSGQDSYVNTSLFSIFLSDEPRLVDRITTSLSKPHLASLDGKLLFVTNSEIRMYGN